MTLVVLVDCWITIGEVLDDALVVDMNIEVEVEVVDVDVEEEEVEVDADVDVVEAIVTAVAWVLLCARQDVSWVWQAATVIPIPETR